VFKQTEKKVIIEKLMYYPPSKGYAVILKEIDSEKKLPIIVGVFEAQAIALAVEKIKMPRPITHDLFTNFLLKEKIKLTKIVISDLIDGTFFANIFYYKKDSDVLNQIDSRPSDAIAIALRMKCDIFVTEKVMKAASQIIPDFITKPVNTNSNKEIKESKEKDTLYRLFQLQEKLQNAIDEENYEEAAKLRDQISDFEDNKNIN